MTVYTLPTIEATDLKWTLASNTQVFSSWATGTVQRRELPGARWTATVSMKNMPPEKHRLWMATLAQLRGMSGSCYLSPSFAFPRRGAGGGTPLVNGASQTGNTLNVDGGPLSTTAWLKVGDYFSFTNGVGDTELKIVVSADVNTDGTGAATITFEPPIRSAPADDAPIEIDAPTAIMRLLDDNQAAFNIRSPYLGDTSIQFIETYPL